MTTLAIESFEVGLVSAGPLVIVASRNGTTDFLPGSHWPIADRRFWMDAETRAHPTFHAGSNLPLFDLGVSHCGCDASPTILYISYVHEGF